MATTYMLTTHDNPFDPSTQFKEWYVYDVSNGYNTSNYLARMTKSSYELSEFDQKVAIQLAIDEIVANDELGIYLKVPVQIETEYVSL